MGSGIEGSCECRFGLGTRSMVAPEQYPETRNLDLNQPLPHPSWPGISAITATTDGEEEPAVEDGDGVW